MTNLSFGVNSNLFTYGIAFTPAKVAILSPNDLDIARPGNWSSFSQTLIGPIGLPFASNNLIQIFNIYLEVVKLFRYSKQFFYIRVNHLAYDLESKL